MRLDYCYRRNGTRGYVQTLSVSRAPSDCKLYAYTAARIATRAPFASEFAAVTDISLLPENERHRFVRDTLRDARIEPVAVEGFAVWGAKLKPSLLLGRERNPRAAPYSAGRFLMTSGDVFVFPRAYS